MLLSKSTTFSLLHFFLLLKACVSWNFVSVKLWCSTEWCLWNNFRKLKPVSVFPSTYASFSCTVHSITDAEKGSPFTGMRTEGPECFYLPSPWSEGVLHAYLAQGKCVTDLKLRCPGCLYLFFFLILEGRVLWIDSWYYLERIYDLHTHSYNPFYKSPNILQNIPITNVFGFSLLTLFSFLQSTLCLVCDTPIKFFFPHC